MLETIRPIIQQLIARGAVEIDEVEHLDPPCNSAETHALIPAWTNSSISRVLDRGLVNVKIANQTMANPTWRLYLDLQEAQKSIERPISQIYAGSLAAILEVGLAATQPATTENGYLLFVWQLGSEIQKRFKNWQ